MAIIYPDRAVTATSNVKGLYQKTIQLRASDFTTTGTASVKAILPAGSSIISMLYWKRTAFDGNGVTAVALSVGIPGAPTNFVNAFDVNTPVAGSIAELSPITNIYQNHSLPLGLDISVLFTGTTVTGNPTSGELMVTIRYVR